MPHHSARSRRLRIGTRGSALALWQTERVRTLLHGAGHETDRIEIQTTGDLVAEIPLSRIGARALFTKQIDDALLAGRIDIAVHSLKDLPTELPDGIILAAVGEREDPRDALVGRGPLRWADLPSAAVVATSSLRRRAQLLRARPDLEIVDIRGNVDTRLTKLEREDRWTAIVLAVAGLARLGLAHRIGERLPADVMLPAPGQGALAATVRADDPPAAAAVRSAMHHETTALAVAAERGFLRRLEGGCQVPVAALAQLVGSRLTLTGRVISLTGTTAVEGSHAGEAESVPAATDLGIELAERLLREGAGTVLESVRASMPLNRVVEAVPEP